MFKTLVLLISELIMKKNYMLVELAGTSIANISQFYGHATDEMKRKAVLKTEDKNAFNFSEAEKVEYNSI